MNDPRVWPNNADAAVSPVRVAQFTSTKFPAQPAALFAQLEDPPRELGFPRAGRPGQQHRCLRAQRHLLDAVDQPVEARIARGDAALQKIRHLRLLASAKRVLSWSYFERSRSITE